MEGLNWENLLKTDGGTTEEEIEEKIAKVDYEEKPLISCLVSDIFEDFYSGEER